MASITPIDLLSCASVVASNSSNQSAAAGASTSSIRNRVRDVVFNIHHQFNVHRITISNQATVGELKAKIMDVTQIPVCRQAITGWMPHNQNCTNATVLNTLNIARENELVLKDMSAEGFEDDASLLRQSDTFTLLIRRMPEDIELTLNFPGHQKLIQIKSDVFTISDIPVRHQDWTGWPSQMTNDTTLAQSGIGLVHNLTLRSTAPAAAAATLSTLNNYLSASAASTAANRRPSNNSNVIEIDSDESEFEDATDADFNADEDMFTEPIVRNRLNYLSES